MALSYGFFQHWMPNQTETKYYQDYATALEEEGNKLPQAEKRLDKAKELVETKAQEWRAVVATKTPLPDVNQRGVNIGVQGWQLVVDSKKFRDNIQRAVNAQLVKGGVKVVGAGPQVPQTTDDALAIMNDFYHYPSIAFPVVILNLGTVTVQGTYEQIMANVRSWKNMPRYLAVADGLQLTGTAPILTGTYSLVVVGYIRGNKVFPAVPQGSTPSGSTGGGPGGGFGPAGVSGAGGRPGAAGPGAIGGPGGGRPGVAGPGAIGSGGGR